MNLSIGDSGSPASEVSSAAGLAGSHGQWSRSKEKGETEPAHMECIA